MRLDQYLYINKYFDSRNKSTEAIKRGEVFIDGKVVNKPSFLIDESNSYRVEIKQNKSFVSLGGYKLSKALDDFSFNVAGLVVADIGASTGGFTDCLLQNGASTVFSVDVNEDLLHDRLRGNIKVKPLIKNAKELVRSDFSLPLNLICADLSFISLTQVIGVFYELIDYNCHVILLIKPQFEMGKRIKFKNGIVRDEKLRIEAVKGVCLECLNSGFMPLKITTAPIVDNKNIEYLILLKKQEKREIDNTHELVENLFNFNFIQK